MSDLFVSEYNGGLPDGTLTISRSIGAATGPVTQGDGSFAGATGTITGHVSHQKEARQSPKRRRPSPSPTAPEAAGPGDQPRQDRTGKRNGRGRT
jgi:hypothetical protein